MPDLALGMKKDRSIAEDSMLTKLDRDLFRKLLARAEGSPRKRSHYNFHNDFHDPVQRVCIALISGTYVRPHSHPQSNKWEMTIVLQGEVGLLIFDDKGVVTERLQLSPASSITGIEIMPGTWHTIFPLGQAAVILEIKEGPYKPADPIDFALWSPTEESAAAGRFVAWAQSARNGESFTP